MTFEQLKAAYEARHPGGKLFTSLPPPKPTCELKAVRSDEFDKLRSDADRWRFVARHWTKAHMNWNRDAGNTPKSLVLEMKFSVTASSGAQVERFIDEAIAAEKAVTHNALHNRATPEGERDE